MNAYKAWWDYGDGSTVVFAETRNQAKVIALSCDCCEDAKYWTVRKSKDAFVRVGRSRR